MSDALFGEGLRDLSPENLRAMLPLFLANYISEPGARAASLHRLQGLAGAWSDDTCQELVSTLLEVGAAGRPHFAKPTARALARTWARDVFQEPQLRGVEHLAEALQGPTVVVGNHRSYIDTTVTDALLTWAGHGELADRLIAAAGPKVYQTPFRRIASMCLNTLPVPQSSRLGHTEQLPVRELARQVRASLAVAAEVVEGGYAVLLYPEGSRSRTGRLGSFLKGVHRYLGVVDGVRVVPLAVLGSHQVMPVGEPKVRPARVSVQFGPALQVGVDGDTREVLAKAFEGVSALLPEGQRPLPGTPAVA